DMNILYYRNLDDDYKIYKAKLSEEFSNEKIIDYSCVYFQKKGNNILFDNIDEELYVVSLTEKGEKPKLVARDINAMNILDDIVLIKDNSGNIYMLTDDYQVEMLEIPE
ncbi:MAG: hypothetical protein GX815_07300, partial [Clostridiales bacterium]|nr:hypothetical protein [Clostridiales bacterium]